MSVDVVQTIWGYLQPGAVIADANGGHWVVAGRKDRLPQVALWVHLPGTDPTTGRWIVQDHDHDVVLVDRSTSSAVELVANLLDGMLVVDTLPTKETKGTIAMWRAHLLHHHKVATTGERTLAGLQECHAIEHASPRPDWLPHIHVKQTRR